MSKKKNLLEKIDDMIPEANPNQPRSDAYWKVIILAIFFGLILYGSL